MNQQISGRVDNCKKNIDTEMQEVDSITNQIAVLNSYLKDFKQAVSAYNTSYMQYLALMSDIADTPKIAPLDSFPGLTTFAAPDREKYEKTSQQMKQCADTIHNQQTVIEQQQTQILTLLQQCVSSASHAFSSQGFVQSEFTDILQSLDNTYDVGFLSKAT